MSSFFTITFARLRIPRWMLSIASGRDRILGGWTRCPDIRYWRRIAAGLFWGLSCAASSMALAETTDETAGKKAAETSAETAYVIDRVLVGVHKNKALSGNALEVLPTGAALSVLSREENLAKVRTADGAVGWVDGDYLMSEKPAQLLLLELEAAHERTRARLRELTGEEFIDLQGNPDQSPPMGAAGESPARTQVQSRLPSLTYGQWGALIAGFLLALFSGGYIAHRFIRYRYYLVERT